MSFSAKNVFAIEYRSVPGKGMIAAGGLKFKTEEAALRKEHGSVVDQVGLPTLLGEAALWVLWPSTVAIWAFPALLWGLSIDHAVLAAIGLFLAVQVASMLFYARWLNYALLALGNRAVQLAVYVVCGVVLWRLGGPPKVVALGIWLALMATGVVQVIFVTPFMPLLRGIFSRSPADQALKNVIGSEAQRAAAASNRR